ncbi:MAG: DUF4124 domain-containing protein [Mariprofundaceae bacterium]
MTGEAVPMRMRLAVAALLGLIGWADAAQAEIYRWKDAAGRLHVTNDPTKVPPAQLERARVRGLRDLNMVAGGGVGGGGALFDARCGQCHLAGMESTGDGEGGDGKLAILPFLIDSETGIPLSRDQALAELKRAVDGQFSDMPRLNVAPEELEKITDFLLRKLE